MRGGVGVNFFGQSKVSQFRHIVFGAYEDIGGFEVAMNQVLMVCRRQCRRTLHHVTCCNERRKLFVLFHESLERVTVNILKFDEMVIIGFADVVDGHDVGVYQRRSSSSFARKHFHRVRFAAVKVRTQNFYGARSQQGLMLRAEDPGHAAAAQELLHFVEPQGPANQLFAQFRGRTQDLGQHIHERGFGQIGARVQIGQGHLASTLRATTVGFRFVVLVTAATIACLFRHYFTRTKCVEWQAHGAARFSVQEHVDCRPNVAVTQTAPLA